MTGTNEKQNVYLMGFYGSLKEKFTIMQFVYMSFNSLWSTKGERKKVKTEIIYYISAFFQKQKNSNLV